jgi:hypothetical protein
MNDILAHVYVLGLVAAMFVALAHDAYYEARGEGHLGAGGSGARAALLVVLWPLYVACVVSYALWQCLMFPFRALGRHHRQRSADKIGKI